MKERREKERDGGFFFFLEFYLINRIGVKMKNRFAALKENKAGLTIFERFF